MIRMQIQLLDVLAERQKEIAKSKDLSLAEIVRRQMENYVETFSEDLNIVGPWKFPTLKRGCGDLLVDPATINMEAEAIEEKGRQPMPC